MTVDQLLDAIDTWLQDVLKAAGYPLATLSVKPTGEYVLLRQAAEEGYPPLPPRFNSKMFTVIIDLPLGANAQAVAQGLKDATNADRTLGDHLFAGARARPADACGREDDIQPRVEMSITIGG